MNKVDLRQGDCLELMKDIPDGSVDMILTDPPYGMSYQSSWRTATPKFNKIKGDQSTEWFDDFIRECYRILKDNSHAYIFCNEYRVSHFRDSQEAAGFKNKRTLVWVKNNHTSGDLKGDYGNKVEYVNFMHKGRRLLNGRRDTNILEYSRVLSNTHPTEKPVDMLSYLIEKSSNAGDTILDPFMGSGSTGVAANNLNRNFIGIELDEAYFEIAKKRIEESNSYNQTNKEALQ